MQKSEQKVSHKNAFLAGAVQPVMSPPEASPNQLAMAWLHTTRFLTTAAELRHLPALDLPEIAFVGRSNAGKSPCINRLTQQGRLAFSSKTPGRTQHINLFSIGRQGQTDAILADLPGYGYAAVPKEAKRRWQQVMANYLVSRPNLRVVVVLVDSRHGLKEIDEILLGLILPKVQSGLKFVLLLTKADKLNKTEAAKALSIAQLQCAGGQAQLFSALNRQGVEQLAGTLHQWVLNQADSSRAMSPFAMEVALTAVHATASDSLDAASD
jgi:GTP-binding protein